ncbi:hypothetical protein RB653_007406 [Dictyostelium firmibasis]|uniref:Uncharacterized protein n=1 Tax=Dictyostelium firmibasis TaxID=79012 RepID=A0AAN7TWG2_9MYCE
MKYFKFIYLIIILVIEIVKSQQIINYYISNNNNGNSNGTISNPFQSLCQLNSILNDSKIPIIINIEYGVYNSTNCTFFLNNIDTISIISYSSSSSSNNRIKNKENDESAALIYNINLEFNNSNIIIDNIIFNFKNETGFIQYCNITFNRTVFLFNSYDYKELYFKIINSKASITNQSVIINKYDWDFYLEESNLTISDSVVESILMICISGNNKILVEKSTLTDVCFIINSDNSMIINNSEIIYINKRSYYDIFTAFIVTNSTLTILNTIIVSSSKFGSSQIIDSSNQFMISFYNVTISNFIKSSLFSLSSGTFIFKHVKFIGCTSSDILTIKGGGSENLDIEFDSVSISTNDYNRFLNLKNINRGNLLINITNFKTECSIYNTFPKFMTTTKEKSHTILNVGSYSRPQINIVDSNLNCFGIMEIVNSDVSFKNVEIQTNFGNYLFHSSNSKLVLNSTSFVIYNINNKGFLFYQISESTLFLYDCNVKNSSSSFLFSDKSNSYIENTKFLQSYSDSDYFFDLSYSSLKFTGVLFDKFNTPGSLIDIWQSNMSITNSTILNSLFSTKTVIDCGNSNVNIDRLIVTNCFSDGIFFYFYNEDIKFTYQIIIENSIFTHNVGMGNYDERFIVISSTKLLIKSCNFSRNSFLPLIDSFNSNITIMDIIYQNNTGSFYISKNDFYVNVSNFFLKDNQIPLSYAFGIYEPVQASFNSITITNNYLNQYFFYLNYKDTFSNYDQIVINDLTFTNNFVLNDKFDNGFPFSFIIPKIQKPISQFIFVNTKCNIKYSIFKNNTISSGMITSIESNITFSNCIIDENLFRGSPNLLNSSTSSIKFFNSSVCSNNAKVSLNTFLKVEESGLMNLTNSDLVIDSCEISNNSFPLSKGGIVYSFLNNATYQSMFSIKNSNFSSNIAKIGGVFYFSSKDISSNYTYSVISNNFIDNNAKESGGAIYNEDLRFPQPSIINSNNIFINNFCHFGQNNVSYKPKEIILNNQNNHFSDETFIYKFKVLDINKNQAFQVFGTYNTSIKVNKLGPNDPKNIKETFVESYFFIGTGSFQYKFYARDNIEYNITIFLDNEPLTTSIFISGCSKNKYYIGDSMNCTYCPIGLTLIYENGNKTWCFKCDSNRMICQDDIVEALDGFYMISPQEVLECPIDFCLKNNTCQPNERNLDNLCYYCSYEYEQPSMNYINSAKSGIQCCSNFEPHLLMLVFIIFIIFGLALSILKYSMFSKDNKLGPLIVFIQVNSVVFFSYRISILPLFRLSIDFIDGYCYYHNLNYLYKVLISYCSILVVAIIGYSDISINFIKINLLILYYIKNKINPIKHSKVITPKFIKIISKRKIKSNGIYKLYSGWSLFQVLFIPLLFNSISLLVSKEVDDDLLSALDFTIFFLNNNHLQIALFTFSIIIIVFITVFLVILFINPKIHSIEKYRSCSRLFSKLNQIYQNTNQMISRLNYSKNFKWWDLVRFSRSIIFISLSLSMIFNPSYYLLSIIGIQILYQSIVIIFKPIKNQRSSIDYPNYIIDLFQLIIFIIVGSSLFSYLSPKSKGIIITCITFFIVLILIMIEALKFMIKKICQRI